MAAKPKQTVEHTMPEAVAGRIIQIESYDTKLKRKVQNDYLKVDGRIYWFRQTNPSGQILTTPLIVGDKIIAVHARVIVDGVEIANGLGTVNAFEKGGGDRGLEKAETAAIGRALAVAGYGTLQAGDELDEGDYLADTPIEPKNNGRSITPKYDHAPPAPQPKGAPELAEVFPIPVDDAPPPETGEFTAAKIVIGKTSGGKKKYVLTADNGTSAQTLNPHTFDAWPMEVKAYNPGETIDLDPPASISYTHKSKTDSEGREWSWNEIDLAVPLAAEESAI